MGTGGEYLVVALVNALLIAGTCGFAAPWVVAMDQHHLASQMTTVAGQPLRFDGSAGDVIGLWFMSVFGLIFTLGMAWPWVAVMWAHWRFTHLLVEDPIVNGGLRRLDLQASGADYFVQGLIGAFLTAITFGLYAPWTLAGFERWLWSQVRDHR